MTIYTSNIPQPGDIPAQSQDQILQNFQSVNDSIGNVSKDLVPLSNTVNRGLHNKSTYIAQSVSPTTAGLQGALYVKDTGAGLTALFWRRNNNAPEIRMTANTVLSASKGYSFLPGNILIQWGTKLAPGSSGSDTFAIAFSAPPYTVQLTLQRNSGNQSVTIDSGTPPTTTGFNYLVSSGGSISINWIAIGPA